MNTSRIDSLQGLRALAALMVVVSHQLPEAGIADEHAWFIGALGVQLFFVISGFIMITTSRAQFGVAGAPGQFIWRRFIRVAPLYWLATIVYGIKLVATGDMPSAAELLKSLAFIPYLDAQGLYRPIYGLGWTLNHEMFFYALFALALSQRFWTGVIALLAVLVGIVVAGFWLAPSGGEWLDVLAFWSSPVILYFVAGVLAGLAREALLRRAVLPGDHAVSSFVVSALVLGVASALAIDPDWRQPMGMLACGVVFCVCAFRQGSRDGGRLHAWIVGLGNASYSIYLTHSFAAGPIKRVWLGVWPDQHPVAMVATITLASIWLGQASYRWVETPLMRLQKLRPPRRTAAVEPAGAASGR